MNQTTIHLFGGPADGQTVTAPIPPSEIAQYVHRVDEVVSAPITPNCPPKVVTHKYRFREDHSNVWFWDGVEISQ